MAALALLIISSLSVVRASGGEVTWETVRRAIGDTICFSAADKAPPKLAFADPDSCTIKAPTPLADAVRRSLVDTRALRATIPGVFSALPPEVEKAILQGNVSRMPLDVIRTTTIKRPEFLNTLMPTLIKYLSDTGITCPDCPRPDAPSHDVPAWEAFFPYVAAFIAIDPVEETRGSVPGKKPVYGFHVCSGAVDDSGIQAKDPVLLHAGFLSALNAEDLIMTGLESALKAPQYRRLRGDDSRATFLRQRILQSMRDSPNVRSRICEFLGSHGVELGLRVTSCSDWTRPSKALMPTRRGKS